MPHGRKIAKLSRTATHRRALLSNMAAALFLHNKIVTTSTKAKALRPLVDRLIAIAKQRTLHGKRQVAEVVRNKIALKKLFDEIIPEMKDRRSGYSRVIKVGFRKGDAAEMSVIELLLEKPKEVAEKEKKEGRLKKISGKLKRSSKGAKKEDPAKGKSAKAAKAKPAKETEEEASTES